MKMHRDVRDTPTDPNERREWIKWLLAHKVWTHPTTVMMPPEGEDIGDLFEPVEGTPFCRMKETPENWVATEVPDGSFYECSAVTFEFVNPATERIEDDESLNTAFRVWVEAGPWHDLSQSDFPAPPGGWCDHTRWGSSHDTRLDCGGDNAEEAMLTLAGLVGLHYHEDGTSKDQWPCWWGEGEDHCAEGDDGFCTACGFKYEADEEDPEAPANSPII